MSYSGDRNIDNSFELTIRNNTTQKQEFSMFELGSEEAGAIIMRNDIISGTPNNFEPYYDFTDLKTWKINPRTYEPLINNWTADFEIGVQAVIISFPSIGGGDMTMEALQGELNGLLEANPTTKYIRLAFQPVIYRGNPSTYRMNVQFTYFEADPITGSTAGYFTGDPNDASNPMLVDNIAFKNFVVGSGVPPPDSSLINVNQFPAKITQTTNNGALSIIATSGTPYNQILESQTGQVLDIKSMRIDSLPAQPTQGGIPALIDAQLLTPLTFKKRDATGNDLEYNKIPTIDPYQFQKSIDFIDMKTKADTFALDGTTRFTSEVQAYCSLRLSCEYTYITNLIADTNYAVEQEKKQEELITQRREEGDSRRTYKLDLPIGVVAGIEKANKESEKVEALEKKKTKSKDCLLYPKTSSWRLVA